MKQSAKGEAEDLVRNAILIAGPTAGGKSALALELAGRHDGIIVNADSMQVYSVLELLTARPGPDALAAAPHQLYGHVHPSRAYSTGEWLRDVERLAREGVFCGRTPVFVGGTGLYFRALTGGLSQMPDISPQIRERWRSALAESGAEKLHALLVQRDSVAAAALQPTDGQRIVRALEVLEASGRSISEWQAVRSEMLIDAQTARFLVICPDRRELVGRIDARFDRMIEAGVLEEVRRLADLRLDPALPATKAIGFRELQAALQGKISMAEAIERAKTATRQYAKRQQTWLRHQLGPQWREFDPSMPL